MPRFLNILRIFFCNIGCYEEYRLRTSNRFLREELFQLEQGICTNCQLDCHKLVKNLKPLSLERGRQYINKVAPKIASRKSFDSSSFNVKKSRRHIKVDKLVSDPSEGNAGRADHIVPVYKGGERRSIRTKAKKKLKAIMADLKKAPNKENGASCGKDNGSLEIIEEIPDDELLVNVPGSAYSAGINSCLQT
ncbi:hypothetical protein F3Y22_tig00002237pilonHSYRG00833 [Hibiscus syriacus]|uniref:Uncharacterized protein n=1 Tax=Hibiscus syriacus TaxID=106335 RepID=A0A6A3CY62_HIBSY|nr:hypothetical protein F3Y22_tig00002237pilonHSYRG00833 [Hibiscus syriacus]